MKTAYKPLFNNITELNQAITNKHINAVEIAQESLKRAKALEHLNAFNHVDEELTLSNAKAVDQQISLGNLSPLSALPLAHKDIFVTKHWRTTASSKMLANYISPFDATVVERLQQSGTIHIGKVSCDEFAMGSGNENSAFGPVHNPWDIDHVPGGSSGGSAAAIASGIVMAATGTDTGGSIRQPAALCGISGIKPTYGVVSRFGMIAFASSLDQGGPMARHAADLVPLLDTMSGFDPKDATSLMHCGEDLNKTGRIQKDYECHKAQFKNSLKGLRIGVPKEYFSDDLDPDMAIIIQEALDVFKKEGAELVDISLPLIPASIPCYYVLAPAEASTNLSRYDGVRYGHRAADYNGLDEMLCKSRAEGFGDEVKRRIMIGSYVLSQGYYDAYYLQAQRVRRLIAEDFKKAFHDQCDVIMGPVTPHVAKRIGEDRDDVTADWLADIFTLGVSLAGLPAMSIPCGFSKSLPVGLHLIGTYFQEGQLLALADKYQQLTDWHTKTPGDNV
ncbi:MAG: Asp-tRNA(Asn)/Glu-tRNA(Gln) amidotransferase subunit GatA [Alcaligenaceae bacterium]|nr:Asp-tRNA(Asn)/Glu-tRNA(Gln) amidotransferase subunit GatA [Alcaligenaceae bacterium]